MVQDTKLSLKDEELAAIENSRFFVVKHDASQKILYLLGELEKELMEIISSFPFLSKEELQLKDKGKIFRGENYRLMPYLILDCPRVFNTESVFAFRSMFRWGNEFSFTLHLQGNALETFRRKIQLGVSSLERQDFFICVNDTPWEYTFDEMNYMPLDKMVRDKKEELEQMISEKKFIKFSRKLELKEYNHVGAFGVETFRKVMEILQ
jgi:hypothetical protein